MLQNQRSRAISILFTVMILSACSSTNQLTLSVTEPATVPLHPSIKKIGILDRSQLSGENKIFDDLDKVLSAEGKNLDREGADAAILGLMNELSANRRLSEVKILDCVVVQSPGMGVFPAQLSWQTVEQICRENDVDAIFVLSFYDTDTRGDFRMFTSETKTAIGLTIPVVEHEVTLNTLIKTGWRIYDPLNKYIIDEFILTENVVSRGRGINPMKAVEAVLDRKEAVLQVSNNTGQFYATRILPFQTRVARQYYVRGTENFKIGKRRAQTGDWDGAAELWAKDVVHRKRKVAGRACYNMAIINEINGDLDNAVKWASQSYTDHKNKLALRYLDILWRRIDSRDELEMQMAGN